MEQKRYIRNNSETQIQKIIIKERKDIKKKITRKKNKSRTIIGKNISIFSGCKHCEYLEQNPDFCNYMEDFILSINNFDHEVLHHLFCVFDGHGGDETAKLCVKRFPEIFRKCLLENPSNYELAIKNSFHIMDQEIAKMDKKETGNTGTIVFINNKMLYCANIGDSSCCLLGKTNEFITIEDKCTNDDEKIRIEKEGGKVIEDRINGTLNISRSFGDYDLKNKGLISEPHITKKLIDNNLNYCILASDGVWDFLNLDDVSKITNENKNNFNDIAKIIVQTAMRKGSEDNISCIVIELNKRIQ